jgi:hypothetical protein
MPPVVAALLFVIGIAGLCFLDRDKSGRISPALWLPTIWVAIAGSRMVSVWVGQGSFVASAAQATDGNALDRNIFSVMILAAGLVLLHRGQQTGHLLRANVPMVLLFGYGALSIFWSDFPAVAAKRWIKAMGDVMMVCVVLTDPAGPEAVKRFFMRVGTLLIPLSVLFIKYFPWLGQGYGGTSRSDVIYFGVATDKNMLGAVCLLTGMACVWRLLDAWRHRDTTWNAGPVLAQSVLLAMTLWLFLIADSMTSLGCFLLASAVMAGLARPGAMKRRLLPHVLVLGMIGLVLTGLFVEAGAGLVEVLGRDQGLTDRTELWKTLMTINSSPVFGAGFESFWLGERLERLWEIYWWRPNESHNGYIEVFLNLGMVGIVLLAIVVIAGYRNGIRSFREGSSVGGMRLACFATALAYACTEAAFRMMHPIWIMFLMMSIAEPAAVMAREVVNEPAVPRGPGTRPAIGAAEALAQHRVPATEAGRSGRRFNPGSRAQQPELPRRPQTWAHGRRGGSC